MNTTSGKKKILLVIECQARLNWHEIFKGKVLDDGTEIQVEQGEWDDVIVTSYSDSGCLCNIKRGNSPHPDWGKDETERHINIDFVLLRSVTRSIKGQDSRHKLFTFMHANLPSVNSLMSAYVCLEKPTVYGALKGIKDKIGEESFPLISQNFYSHHKSMIITPEYPFVAKVAHTHSGYGKIRFQENERTNYADFCSVIPINGDYVSLEPFITWDYDMRIQKIGNHYRGFRRQSGNWKGNVGNMSIIEDMEVTPRYKKMADECAALFGGIDILGLDLVHSVADDKEYILELNDTAIGLVHKHCDEDMSFMAEVVIEKMNNVWVNGNSEQKPQASSTQVDSFELDFIKKENEKMKTEINHLKITQRNLQNNNTSRMSVIGGAVGCVALIALIRYFSKD